jgi:HAD superfamily hydrolase (TIGR02253 family)
MQKKAILFDLDDTLYDFSAAEKIALQETHKLLQETYNISIDEFIHLFRIVRSEIQQELEGTASSHNRVLYFQRITEKLKSGSVMSELILRLYDTYWDTIYKNMKLYDNAVEVLSEIKVKGYKTAIVSNHMSDVQHKKLVILGITKYIDVLVTSEEAGTDKPNPFIFLLALNKLNILPAEAIMVGDSTEGDITGANSVHITTIKKLVSDDEKIETNIEDHKKPDYTIRQLSDILSILNKIENT